MLERSSSSVRKLWAGRAVVVCQFYVQLDIGGIERNCCEAASFRFGHGNENLASVLLVFNLLALAVHAARKITEFKPK